MQGVAVQRGTVQGRRVSWSMRVKTKVASFLVPGAAFATGKSEAERPPRLISPKLPSTPKPLMLAPLLGR